MNCEEVMASIEALHDHGIEPHGKRRIEAHISTCAQCRAFSHRLSSLSALLRRSRVPAPSPDLDVRLERAFRRQYGPQASAPAWWRLIFAGSVTIPKPVLAAAVVAVAAALAGAAMFGRITPSPSGENSDRAKIEFPAAAPARPEVVEVTKFVEVPVVREKVVMRTVFVNRARAVVDKVRPRVPTSGQSERGPAMSGSVGENGYFTVADLSGFQPAKETRARVVRGVQPDDK